MVHLYHGHHSCGVPDILDIEEDIQEGIKHEDEGLFDAGDGDRPVSGHWAGVYA